VQALAARGGGKPRKVLPQCILEVSEQRHDEVVIVAGVILDAGAPDNLKATIRSSLYHIPVSSPEIKRFQVSTQKQFIIFQFQALKSGAFNADVRHSTCTGSP